jgi:two-component system cell cycle response regulator DivK
MKTALVIEDDNNNMELITVILELDGYQVIKAETGQKGFELAEEKLPDFIILDIQLPDMTGLEVLEKIRTSKTGENTPVIAMTSFAMSGDREKLLAAGCNGYIEKPIDPDKVMAQVESILEKT